MKNRSTMPQRGGFLIGAVVGLLVGLALALGVALYVTKVPVPFINKVPQRTAVQDAAEVEKNRNWDPNGPLSGKNPARAASSGVAATGVPPASTTAPAPILATAPPVVPPTLPPPLPRSSAVAASAPPPSAAASRPARSLSTDPGGDPFTYFVQAGAYGRPEDAEQQRARLAMMGMEARMSEREQAGRTVYRVRVGPFDRKDDADVAKDRLDGAGVDAALVRVQR